MRADPPFAEIFFFSPFFTLLQLEGAPAPFDRPQDYKRSSPCPLILPVFSCLFPLQRCGKSITPHCSLFLFVAGKADFLAFPLMVSFSFFNDVAKRHVNRSLLKQAHRWKFGGCSSFFFPLSWNIFSPPPFSEPVPEEQHLPPLLQEGGALSPLFGAPVIFFFPFFSLKLPPMAIWMILMRVVDFF